MYLLRVCLAGPHAFLEPVRCVPRGGSHWTLDAAFCAPQLLGSTNVFACSKSRHKNHCSSSARRRPRREAGPARWLNLQGNGQDGPRSLDYSDEELGRARPMPSVRAKTEPVTLRLRDKADARAWASSNDGEIQSHGTKTAARIPDSAREFARELRQFSKQGARQLCPTINLSPSRKCI